MISQRSVCNALRSAGIVSTRLHSAIMPLRSRTVLISKPSSGESSTRSIRSGSIVGSDHFCDAGHGDFGLWRRGVPAVTIRHKVLPGVERLVPRDSLPGIGGHAAHDGHQGALAHVTAVIDRFPGADAGEQFVVLGLLRDVLLATICPLRAR